MQYRKRELVPEDTQVDGRITGAKIVRGRFGRQVELDSVITKGEFRGTEIKDWFGFSTDKETGAEFISYGGRLFSLLLLAEADLDDLLLDAEDEAEVERIVVSAVKALRGIEFQSRVIVKHSDEPDRARNAFDAGTMGRAEEPSAPF